MKIRILVVILRLVSVLASAFYLWVLGYICYQRFSVRTPDWIALYPTMMVNLTVIGLGIGFFTALCWSEPIRRGGPK